jgi:hypothetical protein
MNSVQDAILAEMAKLMADPALALREFISNLCTISYDDKMVMLDTAALSSRIQQTQVT